MPIELTLCRADQEPIDPLRAKTELEALLEGIEFEESEDPQVRYQQLAALKTPQVILDHYKNMKRKFEGVIETEAGSIYVEFGSREPFQDALVEVRGEDLHLDVIARIIESSEWTLMDATGSPITRL